MKIKFQNIGWRSKVSQKRSTLSISINKLVVVGSCLKKGDVLYSYLGEDENGRVIMVTYLDRKEKNSCDSS